MYHYIYFKKKHHRKERCVLIFHNKIEKMNRSTVDKNNTDKKLVQKCSWYLQYFYWYKAFCNKKKYNCKSHSPIVNGNIFNKKILHSRDMQGPGVLKQDTVKGHTFILRIWLKRCLAYNIVNCYASNNFPKNQMNRIIISYKKVVVKKVKN